MHFAIFVDRLMLLKNCAKCASIQWYKWQFEHVPRYVRTCPSDCPTVRRANRFRTFAESKNKLVLYVTIIVTLVRCFCSMDSPRKSACWIPRIVRGYVRRMVPTDRTSVHSSIGNSTEITAYTTTGSGRINELSIGLPSHYRRWLSVDCRLMAPALDMDWT